MAMKKLSGDLQCLISSSLQINNFKRVAEELVYNALDAKATSIAVRINIDEKKIQVVDNGCGITESDFDLLGNKYSTSKCVDVNTLKSVPHTYGFRGQFLANLIKIAQKVKITSRYKKGEDTWVKIFYNGKERDLAKTTTRPSVGTTVEVSALFYNLHIQSKKIESFNELSKIKTLLKQLTLVHNNISISLRDDSKNEIIFKAHKNRSIYQTFGLLFNIDEKDIEEFKVEKNEYKVTAYFGKKDKDVGEYHWIFLNGKFLNNCKLHKIVNDNLSKSRKHISKRTAKPKIYEEEDIFTKLNIPFYIISLSCPYYDYDINDSSKHTSIEFKNWVDITNLLKKLIEFYFGDLTLKKQTKHECVKINHATPKDDDTRDQVRKIVEKLLKSNSRKLGVSQMKNGVKGKMTKRKKKIKKSFNVSLSKVIPSKNKLSRNQNKPSKNKLNKSGSNDEIVRDSSKIQNVATENVNKDSNNEIKEMQIPNKNSNNLSQLDLENIKTTSYRVLKERNHDHKNYNICCVGPNEKFKHFKKEEKIYIFNDSFKSIDFCRSRNMKGKDEDIMQERHYMTNNNIKREKILKENDVIFNIKNNNKQITIRKNIEEIIVYDYIPHPLNSSEGFDRYQRKLSRKPHISSRDLVKTILNTQQNDVPIIEDISLNGKETHEPKISERSFDIETVFSTKPYIERNKNTKNSHDSTFKVWNFDLQSNTNISIKEPDDNMYVSKLTFESHRYNQNHINNKKYTQNYIDNSHKIKYRKFIPKYSKENFNVSKENKKTKNVHRNKFNHFRRTNFHDNNMSFGVKNLIRLNNNFLQESSFMIEFSNSNRKDQYKENLNKAIYEQNNSIIDTNNHFVCTNNLSKWAQKSNLDELPKGNSVNSEVKNTYTISNDSSNIRDTYTIHSRNNESFRYAENVTHGTYTMETHNDESLYIWRHSDEMNDNKYIKDVRNDKDESNIVFLSEQQIEKTESSAEKNIEPINVCETILSISNSCKSLSDMEIDLNHDIAKQCPETRKESNTERQKESQREVSHHFYASISNTIAPNLSYVSNKDLNACNSNLDGINNTTNNDFDLQSPILDQYKDVVHPKLPEDTNSKNFSIKIRPRYMPKGLSQIFENSNTKAICDYKLDVEYYKCNIYKDFNKEIQVNAEIFKPIIQNATEETTKAIEKVNLKLNKENSSLTFNGQLLKRAQIFGQVDGKFIAAIVKSKSENKDFLVLFDQHAVHERIRLENNMSDYFNHQKWKSVNLDDFMLKLSNDEIIYLHNYKEKFTQLGLEWNILSDYEVSVSRIPEAILGKNPRQVEKVVTAIKNLILEEINVIKSQGGCISLHPKSIMDLVFSEACRYAIKFGDKLSINNCKELIQSLSECKTPFQCAHGRPVMAVLMEMTSSDVPEYKIDVSKIRLFCKSSRK